MMRVQILNWEFIEHNRGPSTTLGQLSQSHVGVEGANLLTGKWRMTVAKDEGKPKLSRGVNHREEVWDDLGKYSSP